MFVYQRCVDALRGQGVQCAVVGLLIDAPEARPTDVGETRTELISKQMENAEHRVGIGPGIRHDFGRLQFGLLFQHDREQHQAVTQGARHGDAIQPGELVGDQIVERDPALLPEIAWVRP